MKAIIVDDEQLSREIIKHMADRVPSIEVVGVFSNAMQAIKFLNKNEVELMFLDIHMPEFSGFDLIETLKDPPKIVMVSSDRNFAVEAYEYDFIVDYIVKPLEFDRFEKTVVRIKNRFSKNKSKVTAPENESEHTVTDDKLYVNIDRRLVKIDISSIDLVEAKGDYIKIKTEKKNFVVHCPLKRIEEKLPKEKFLKVHRSFVINIDKIVDIEDNSVLIKRDVIPVSKGNRNELRQRLNLL